MLPRGSATAVSLSLTRTAVGAPKTSPAVNSVTSERGAPGSFSFVVVPAGKIALGKAVQVLAHGAEIVQIEGNFDAALRISQEIAAERGDVTLVNSVNPDRIEGQ